MTQMSFDFGDAVAPAVSVDSAPLDGAQRAKQLPQPASYHLLCALPEISNQYESGLLKADQTLHHEEILSPVLFVVAMGPTAYKDPVRFPAGPSCKVGDFVLVRPNTGTRVKIHGKEFRIIHDDSVQAVVEDPRGVSRV